MVLSPVEIYGANAALFVCVRFFFVKTGKQHNTTQYYTRGPLVLYSGGVRILRTYIVIYTHVMFHLDGWRGSTDQNERVRRCLYLCV